MAGFKHGKAGAFTITDTGSSERDVSAYVSNVDMNLSVDLPETTTLGAAGVRRQVVGLEDVTITVTGFHDIAANTGSWTVFTALLGFATASTFEWGPEGTASSAPRITGSCRVASFQSGSPVDGVVPFTVELVGDGGFTVDTF